MIEIILNSSDPERIMFDALANPEALFYYGNPPDRFIVSVNCIDDEWFWNVSAAEKVRVQTWFSIFGDGESEFIFLESTKVWKGSRKLTARELEVSQQFQEQKS